MLVFVDGSANTTTASCHRNTRHRTPRPIKRQARNTAFFSWTMIRGRVD